MTSGEIKAMAKANPALVAVWILRSVRSGRSKIIAAASLVQIDGVQFPLNLFTGDGSMLDGLAIERLTGTLTEHDLMPIGKPT